jgi:hypothetical protein
MAERLADTVDALLLGNNPTETRARAREAYGALPVQRARALFCCRQMESLEPLRMPELPDELDGVAPGLIDSAVRMRADGKELDELHATVLSAFNQYRSHRGRVVRDNLSRLSGAFWAMRTLSAAVAVDPSDREASEQVSELLFMLQRSWGIYEIPAGQQEQAALAEQTANARAGVLFPTAAQGAFNV